MVAFTGLSCSSVEPCKKLSSIWTTRNLPKNALKLSMVTIYIPNFLRSSFQIRTLQSLTRCQNSSVANESSVTMIAMTGIMTTTEEVIGLEVVAVVALVDEAGATRALKGETHTTMINETTSTMMTTMTTMMRTTMMKRTIAIEEIGRKTVATTRERHSKSGTSEETAEEAEEAEEVAITTEVATVGAITEATTTETKETIDRSLDTIEIEVPNLTMTTPKPKTRRESST